MAANLPYEFSKYSRNCKHLRRILKDTKRSLEEITRSGYFKNPEQLMGTRLKPEDEKFIRDVTEQPVGIVVFGLSCWAKACVVNELFGQPLLPAAPTAADDQEGTISWRTVRFTYGNQTQISLALPDSFELVKHLAAYEQPWHTVPRADLELKDDELSDPALGDAVLEIRLRHPLLRDDVQVIVAPSSSPPYTTFERIFNLTTEGVSPIMIYAIGEDTFTDREINDLTELKRLAQNKPIFFVRARPPASSELTESEQHALNIVNTPLTSTASLNNSSNFWPRSYQPVSHLQQQYPPSVSLQKRRESLEPRSSTPSNYITIFQQLCGIGFLSLLPLESKRHRTRRRSGPYEVDCELVENFDNFPSILLFVRHILQSLLVNSSTMLNEAHALCLRMFILTAFDMTWDMMITPRRLDYAKQRESRLYESLLEIASHKQEEIRVLIVDTIDNMKEELIEKAAHHEFRNISLSESQEISSPPQLQICSAEIQDLVLNSLNNAVAGKLIGSVEYLRESFLGTLERCLLSLEQSCKENGESIQASNALKQILNAAYQVEVTVKTSSSLLRVLWEKMKQVVQGMPWKNPPKVDEEWKRRVAAEMLTSLSEWRLAKSICSQFRERLRLSHEHFSNSMKQLEALHSGRLERTEEQRVKVRKYHAPRIARYSLESTSLRDVILFGMPQLGREIGRGQYGVVYSCDSWGGYSPCAVKSVVPPDDKHWNDLAMEFYYTRCIPEHDRIVQIRGSVIDHSYGGGSTPAVLLIMERLQRDLYSAIKTGIDWLTRLQLALDVVQGIRYLHSQGLVHRDIKLKNVLLDKKNRAKITDLGFCKPEAMMSGSIVGTPIHMAPELFTGKYDNSVDVYAFGILFWYICAGHVKLPYVFDQCQNKDQLWNCVRKGARPERLPQFDDNCWKLMEDCWDGEYTRRPLLGDVEPRLQSIMDHYLKNPPSHTQRSESASRVGMAIREKRILPAFASSPYVLIDYCPI